MMTILIDLIVIECSYDIPGDWMEKTLLKDLLHNYEKRARPVVDGVSPIAKLSEKKFVQQITIEFGLSLIQILELNENEQVLTTSVRTLYRWSDYHLVWNPDEYENITHVNIPTKDIWMPDIALYNYADERLEERRQCDARVNHMGTVEWQPRAIYKTSCSIHIKYFPFDQQNCSLKFGPWTYDSSRTNITFYDNSDVLDLTDYEQSPEWDLVQTKSVYTGIQYECCAEIFPDITFYLIIKRQPAFYNYVIILPCFLLSSLTLVLFCLPPETPAKMQLGMNMFQAFNFLLLILIQSIPSAASSFPLIGTYYCINMFLVTLSTFLCLLVVNCHFRGDSHLRVPSWMKLIIIDYGAKLFFVNVQNKTSKTKDDPTRTVAKNLLSDANTELANAAHIDKLAQKCFRRESYKDCICDLVPQCTNEMMCYGNWCPAFECQQHVCQCKQEKRMPYAPIQTHCNQSSHLPDNCCQNCVNDCDHVSMYREQEPPSLTNPYGSNKCAQPKSLFVGEDDQSEKFCPACTGLAVVAAANDESGRYRYPKTNQVLCSNDPDAALADVWASATKATVEKPIYDSYNRRRDLTCSDHYPNCQTDPSFGFNNHTLSYYTPNSQNMLTKCLDNQTCKDIKSNGNSHLFNKPHSYLTNQKSDLFCQKTFQAKQCQQCDAEAAMLQQRDSWYSNDPRQKSVRDFNKTDIRVLRRIATVTKDIAEIVHGIRYFQKKNENKEKINRIVNEWRAVGGVLDRLFFVSYVLAISISIILYFPRSADHI